MLYCSPILLRATYFFSFRLFAWVINRCHFHQGYVIFEPLLHVCQHYIYLWPTDGIGRLALPLAMFIKTAFKYCTGSYFFTFKSAKIHPAKLILSECIDRKILFCYCGWSGQELSLLMNCDSGWNLNSSCQEVGCACSKINMLCSIQLWWF